MYDEQGAEYIDCINNVAHGRYDTSGWGRRGCQEQGTLGASPGRADETAGDLWLVLVRH